MTSLWRLVTTPPARGAWNMAVDEAILEAAGGEAVPPTLRLYAWDPPCLSLGHAQPLADVDRARLQELGWDLVRRPTGGRAILHTDELTYSVAGPADDPLLDGAVLDSYNRIAHALQAAVRRLGMPVEMKDPTPGARARSAGPVCFEVPSAYEITVNGRKLIGSAQSRRRQGVLQHGTLPLYGDLARITQVLVFPDEQARRQAGQRLLERAVTVEASLGQGITWEQAARVVVDAFRDTLHLDLRPAELTPSELERAARLEREKYAHPSWTERI